MTESDPGAEIPRCPSHVAQRRITWSSDLANEKMVSAFDAKNVEFAFDVTENEKRAPSPRVDAVFEWQRSFC